MHDSFGDNHVLIECKYIFKGDIEYQVEKEVFTLHEGDTLFFDGRAGHRLRNIGPGEALMLVFYLFRRCPQLFVNS